MTTPLSWTITGNDRLSEVLEKLDANLGKLSRKLDQVGVDARQMGRQVADAHGPTRRLASEADHASGRLNALGDRMAGVASRVGQLSAAIVTFASVGVGALAAIGLKTAAANESAQISFDLLLKDAKKATDFLQALQKFSANTPFDMPQLRTAASRLLAVGVAAGDVIPLLTGLGDATAGMNTGAEGIERAVTALTQMKLKGKVSAEEMMQLTEAGIPAWESLAAVLNTDVQSAMKMVEKRQIDALQVFEAIKQKAGPTMQSLSGMMEKQSKTLTGVWDAFKDKSSQALATFVEPALPALKRLVDGASAAVPEVLDKLRGMSGRVRGIFEGSDVPERLMSSLREMGQKLLPVLSAAWDRVVGAIERNKEGLEKLGRFVADIVIPLMGGSLAATITGVSLALEATIEVAARAVDAIKFMTQGMLTNLKLILAAATITFGWIPGLKEKLKEANEKFDEFARSVMSKLDALDGKKVDVYVEAHLFGSAAAAARVRAGDTSGILGGRASGGPVWPGQVYTWREQGRGEGLMLSGMSGTVVPEQGMRSRSGGQGDDTIKLDITLRYPSGEVIREELLEVKRRRGFGRLGLA